MKKFKELTKSEKLNRIKDILAKKKFELCEGSENSLGEGGFGAVFKVQEKERKNHIYAAKMIFDDVKDKEEKVKEFRGKNIIKILYHYMDKEEDFYMIIMELSSVGDLEKLIGTQNKKGLLTKEKEKRIFEEPFEEKFGDNLTRFFAKQLINAIKNFYMGKLVHFDIKPPNALLFKNLELKLIDFSLVQKIDSKYEEEKGTIPGGTRGFVTPEYYNPSGIPMDFTKLQSQDFFAIGATIFYLKYGERMLDYLPYVEDLDKEELKKNPQKLEREKMKRSIRNELTGDILTYEIDYAMNYIKRQKFQDKDFDDFIINLIQFKPEDRLNFEKVIRNKWLNKNSEEIEKIVNINYFDEAILLLELQKSDFLINHVKENRKKFDEQNELDNKMYKTNKKGKFKFGKKLKKYM